MEFWRWTGVTFRQVDRIYHYWDHAGEHTWQQTPGPNQTGLFMLLAPPAVHLSTKPVEVALLAVLFEDGPSAGDPQWVSVIVEKRKARLQALEDAVKMLRAAQTSNELPDQLVSKLQEKITNLNKPSLVGKHHAEQELADATWRPFQEVCEMTVHNIQTGIRGGDAAFVIETMLKWHSASIETLRASKPSLISGAGQ
jgi:hypothetical protein